MRTVEFAVDAGTVDPAAILDERAREMALVPDAASAEGDLHLVVRVGSKRVALKMSALRAVVPPPPITALRIDGVMFVGLVALSGEVVPVVDLAALLELQESPVDGEGMLVVVDDAGFQLAVRVDRVEGHETLRPHLDSRIDLSDSAAADARLATPVGGQGLLVLDIDAALADPRLSLPDAGPGLSVDR